ncbi:MAG TPA: hypothetical protein VFE24_14730 [Pirellulales bacterium]|jgi:hypothetical protein|nr:hypothetical protein [Pirellulales bacterium]
MSLKDLVKQELSGLAPFSSGAQALSLTVGVQQFECQLVALDSLACAFESFRLRTPALASASIEELKSLSARLSAKVSYLLETIGALEADAEQCVVQMRSMPPQKDEEGTSYYELLIRRGGELRLDRYRKLPGDVRQVVAAQVTREVFFRLVQDFSETAGG